MDVLVYEIVEGGMQNMLTGEFVASEIPPSPQALLPADNLLLSNTLFPGDV